MTDRRVLYATAVFDQDEIDAVLGVLKDGAGTLRIGRNVAEMERRVAELFGKAGGVMCNSGSSALYLAVELLDLSPGDEVITSPLTFSTDLAPLIRAGLVPVFVDVEPDTFNVDAAAIEGDDRTGHEGDPDAQPRRQHAGLGHDPRRSPTATGSR